jgi:hypothetical protein
MSCCSRALVLCCFVLPAVVFVASNVVPCRALALQNNHLGGTLPTNWGNMTALTYALEWPVCNVVPPHPLFHGMCGCLMTFCAVHAFACLGLPCARTSVATCSGFITQASCCSVLGVVMVPCGRTRMGVYVRVFGRYLLCAKCPLLSSGVAAAHWVPALTLALCRRGAVCRWVWTGYELFLWRIGGRTVVGSPAMAGHLVPLLSAWLRSCVLSVGSIVAFSFTHAGLFSGAAAGFACERFRLVRVSGAPLRGSFPSVLSGLPLLR